MPFHTPDERKRRAAGKPPAAKFTKGLRNAPPVPPKRFRPMRGSK